jgi:hypothetical protein
VELVATLFTDLPLDARRFLGVLRDLARNGAAGSITPSGLEARHCFGNPPVEQDINVIHVRVKPADSAPASALRVLHSSGFRAQHAVEFYADPYGGRDARENAWALTHAYAAELCGWVLTCYLNFAQATARCNRENGLLTLPSDDSDQADAVLISATTMKLLTP